MFKQIRTSKVSKIIACYLTLMIFIQLTQPLAAYALTDGPSQPEFNSFTPIGTSDMVDLASGDFNYNIPIMDVGGYPLNLAYNSGVTMDQEASWVGLGWNLNVGQISRNVRGLPDDFNGDEIITQNNLKKNVTVGVNAYINTQIIGVLDAAPTESSLGLNAGLDVSYNNYSGISAVPSFGASFKLSDHVSVGMQLSSSVENGTSFTPSVSISTKSMDKNTEGKQFVGSISPSITYNSRQGLQSFNLSSSVGFKKQFCGGDEMKTEQGGRSGSGSISFINNTFTPTKRLAFKNNCFRFSFSGGPDLWTVHSEISIAGYASVQSLVDKVVYQKAYGYENSDLAGESGLLDFNREKEQTIVSKNTLVLPVTNYTYDIYSIQGQGIGGTFRPFRSQVGYLYDGFVRDQSSSNSAGIEMEVGGGAHLGLNFRTTNSNTYTGNWNTKATRFLKEKRSGNTKDYEKVYFKSVGETRVDQESYTLLNQMGNIDPITLKLDVNKDAVNNYLKKITLDNQSSLNQGTPFNTSIKRNNREFRNQTIQKFTKKDVNQFGLSSLIKINDEVSTIDNTPLIPYHHTAGYIVTDENGSRHVYGDAVYNKEKKEVSFNVGLNPIINRVSQNLGIVTYGGSDNTPSNSKGRDHYFNGVKTPPFAHTYLLTTILSNDYSDITGNGPTDDDLGTYTQFDYEKKSSDYKWRIPISRSNVSNQAEASYNEGLKTDGYDQKGSYLYGVKELKYLKRIVTKTHVAYFDLEPRNDGLGVGNEKGFVSNVQANKMYSIKSIRLYSKPEIFAAGGTIDNPGNNVKPIKTAHFKYNYSLSPNIDNNNNEVLTENGVNINQSNGKLTLKKVYFTYRNSNMGKYTPYEFFYEGLNPAYHVKAYDIWGNYKPFLPNSWQLNSENTTPQEFPYVNQENRTEQDIFASAWSLTSVKLPSGGKIVIDYESDDYQYVQDKKAMQMFKVHGVTNYPENYNENSANHFLYNNFTGEDAKYVVIKLPENLQNDITITQEQILRKYTNGLLNKPIYFNFLLNMTSQATDFEYVSGYFEMDEAAQVSQNKEFLFIPMKKIDREGKSSTGNTNPISVAGWFFGRQNLNSQVYGLDDPTGETPINVIDVGKSLVRNLGEMLDIFIGPNEKLKKDFNCAREFKPNKSWIRLLEPTGSKIGGGSRVKRVILNDEWESMLSINQNSADLDRYKKQYGQHYDYKLDNSTSSGVATYEPNISKENPLIIPFYHRPEKLTGQSYQEEPFGESFFPSPTVTYSKVTVSNITASPNNPSRSGKVVTRHYTSYDFPTRTDFTNLDKSKIFETNENEVVGDLLKGLLGLKIDVSTNLTLTQGFVIETNDMNGKLRKQEVFNNANALISSVEYKYSTEEDNSRKLKNNLPTIDEKGEISEDYEIATHFDVYNDFRESYNNTSSFGVSVNTDLIPLLFPIIVGLALPERSTHKQILHTAVTTKVIHKSGILKEKIAFDLGSKVYTKNHAWDAKTGQVLLTETVNEFDDQYYSFNFPAYWYHKEMGLSSQNIDIVGVFNWIEPILDPIDQSKSFKVYSVDGADITNFLKPGDELIVRQPQYRRLWVYGYNSLNNGVKLMRANGEMVESFSGGGFSFANRSSFRIFRSSFRNQQMASMASITLMNNPIRNVNGQLLSNIQNSFLKTTTFDPKIINASAVEYNQTWLSQCENGLPQPGQTNINEYLFNIKGLWKPVKSYAFLTGRKSLSNSNTRITGYYNTFNPFYKINDQSWSKDSSNWTYASEVTQYNPNGVELENKDALNRFSSAQYGYQYTLPTAVASNSEYKEMGFDGFEDYLNSNTNQPSSHRPHFGFSDLINPNAFISNKVSHTGNKSILINPGNSIILNRKLEACD